MRILVLCSLLLAGCGPGEVVSRLDCKTPLGVAIKCAPVSVVKYGDSITHDEFLMLTEYLPVGSSVENRGEYGATALHMILNDMPTWDTSKIYVISYGANECRHRFSTEQYISDMRTVLSSGPRARLFVEAPWRMTGCLERIDSYRAALVGLTNELGVKLIDGDLRQDHAGDGIHLNPEHTRARVELVASKIMESM
jgi:hypothetical protein